MVAAGGGTQPDAAPAAGSWSLRDGRLPRLALVPAGLRRRLHGRRSGWTTAWALLVRPRVGELLCNTVRLIAGRDACSRACIGVGCRLAGRAHRPAGPTALARAAGRAAGGPGVRQQLRLGLADPRRRGVRRGAADRHAVLLPARLPAGRGDAARARPGPRGGGAVARPAGLGDVLPGRRCRSCGRPCSAAGCSSALHLLAEFGALQMLRFPTFTTAIYDQYRSSFNGPAANMLASVLVLCCLLLLLAELRLRGHQRYCPASASGAARPAIAPAARPVDRARARRPRRRSWCSPSACRSAASCTG